MVLRTRKSKFSCGACGETFKYTADDAEFVEGDFNEHVTQHRVGFCLKCKRWDKWGEGCPRCGTSFELQEECHQELRFQFASLVLALQDVVLHTNEKKAVQLDPKLWGNEPQAIVKAAINPLFWSNMTTPDVRMAIGMLLSVAGQFGVATEQAKEAGVEVVMANEDGSKVLMWKSLKTGQYTKIRDLPPEIQQGPVVRSNLTCGICDEQFPTGFALGKHRKEAHA